MPNNASVFLFEPIEARRLLSTTATLSSPPPATPHDGVAYAAAAAPSIIDMKDDVYGVVHQDEVPGGQVAVISDGSIAAVGANGKRVAGKKQKVTQDDRFNLGSSGKAMTSTMIARLIELGKLDWETRLVTTFPELKGKITKSFESVTVWQLMTNRSGISDDVSSSLLIKLGTLKGSNQQKRAAMVPLILGTRANGSPGAKFEYSNFAYAVLGAVAERVTGSSFESLMYTYVFKPLKMDSAGFGAHGKDSKVYDPRGHDSSGKAKTASNDDRLPYLAPAGTMTMSIIDWGKFLKAQMGLPTRGKYLLKQGTLDRLHTPYDGSGTQYAAGWVVTKILGVTVLSHDGTNGNWYSTEQLIPSLKYAVFSVVNQGGTSGMQAAYDLKEKAIDRVPYLDF